MVASDSNQSALTNLVRRVFPRPLRNLMRRPGYTARWLGSELRYRLGQQPVYQVREDWQVRCHPISSATFVAHRDNDDVRQELAAFVAHCTPGMVLLDIGAHFGAFTLAALHFGGPEARVIAVEPSAEARRVLKANLELAGALDRVQTICAAVGSADGKIPMLSTGPIAEHFMVCADASRPDAVFIPCHTIATFVDQAKLVPTHIKIDVEGAEYEAIQGGREILRQHSPVVFLELHSMLLRRQGQRPEEVLDLLADCGYTHLEWRGRPISPAEAVTIDIGRFVCTK
jgi:FkbM family methyltransferase